MMMDKAHSSAVGTAGRVWAHPQYPCPACGIGLDPTHSPEGMYLRCPECDTPSLPPLPVSDLDLVSESLISPDFFLKEHAKIFSYEPSPSPEARAPTTTIGTDPEAQAGGSVALPKFHKRPDIVSDARPRDWGQRHAPSTHVKAGPPSGPIRPRAARVPVVPVTPWRLTPIRFVWMVVLVLMMLRTTWALVAEFRLSLEIVVYLVIAAFALRGYLAPHDDLE